MQTKSFSAAFLTFCCVAVAQAQNEIYQLKSEPVPFVFKDYKAKPIYPKLLKPLPFINWRKNNIDTTNFNYKTDLGEILIDPQDAMPILKPYPQSTYHERTSILNPQIPFPFGRPSYVYPMPNPLKKALITE